MKKSNNTPGGILVRLKNKLCLAMGIDSHKLRVLIDQHVMRAFDGKVNSKVHWDKVNTYNDLTRPEMTVKVLFKFFKILDPKSIKITIELTTRNDQKFSVSEDIMFMTPIKEKEEEESK